MNPGDRSGTFGCRHLPSAALLAAALTLAVLTLAGCASPGPPRAPSLQLPDPVHDLTATREGNAVTIRFTLPERTTDNLPIREGAVQASLCMGPEGSPCAAIPSLQNQRLTLTPGESAASRGVTWTDPLPPADTTGEPTLLAFRVQLSNLGGKTAGWSQPAYTASGAAPQSVEDLHADETRSGILLHWRPSSAEDEVLLRREDLAPAVAHKKSDETQTVWLVAHAEATGPNANQTLDTSATEDVPYRYAAIRRRTVSLGPQKIELRSAISTPAEVTWRNLFPPPGPTGLTAAPFNENGEFAVDLVWDPVEEAGLQGYIVMRSAGAATEQLTPKPIQLPAYHDATAKPGVRYQYIVQAVSRKGIHSPSAIVTVEPTTP